MMSVLYQKDFFVTSPYIALSISDAVSKDIREDIVLGAVSNPFTAQ